MAPAARSARSVPLPARLDRRGVRLAGPGRRLPRDDRLRSLLALFGLQGRGRPPRQRLVSAPSGCRWCISNCSNNYGPYHFPEKLIPLVHPERARGQAAAGLRRRLQRARLAVRRGPRARAASHPHAGPARREIQRRRRQRAHQPRSRARASATSSIDLVPDGAEPRAASSRSWPTGPATTIATPSTPASWRRELGWRAQETFESGLAKTVALVSRQPRLVGAAAQRRVCRRAAGAGRDKGASRLRCREPVQHGSVTRAPR